MPTGGTPTGGTPAGGTPARLTNGYTNHDTTVHEEPQQHMQERGGHLGALSPAVEVRPSSFEIMGCLLPNRPEQSTGAPSGHAAQPVPLRRNFSRLGRDPIPSTVSAGRASAGGSVVVGRASPLGSVVLLHPTQGPTALGAHQGGRQPANPNRGIRTLVILAVASSLTLASFLMLTQSVAVIAIYRAAHQPVKRGYIVECVLSIAFLLPSAAVIVLVATGRDLTFACPYTLRSPFTRRQHPQPKELELGAMNRPATAATADAERGQVQHQRAAQRAVTPAPAPAHPAESRVRLLQPAASSATMAPSVTQTSIVTELCDAVSTPHGRASG